MRSGKTAEEKAAIRRMFFGNRLGDLLRFRRESAKSKQPVPEQLYSRIESDVNHYCTENLVLSAPLQSLKKIGLPGRIVERVTTRVEEGAGEGVRREEIAPASEKNFAETNPKSKL